MPRTAANITQADVARTLLAAKKVGAKSVDVVFGMDGTVRMRVILADVGNDNTPAAPTEEIVL